LIASKTQSVRFSSFLLLCGVPFIPLGPLIQGPSFLPHYTPLFLMGIAGMLRKVGVSTRKEFWLTTILAVVSSFASMDERGLPETIVGVVTLVCILNMKSAPIVMLLIGDISYSLYVIHQPIGGRVVNLGVRFVPHFFSSIVPFVAVFIVLIAAYLMYTFVELPAKRWAARFRYAPISSDPGMPAEKNVGHVTNMGFKKAE